MIADTAPKHWLRANWPLVKDLQGHRFAVLFCEQRTVKDFDRRSLEKRLGCRIIPNLFDAVRQPDNLVTMLGGPPVVTIDVPRPGASWWWTPIDESLYQPDKEKTVECLFLGRIGIYQDRNAFSKSKGEITFIERNDNFCYRSYAKTLSGAKTIVNFAADRTNGLMAMKGRVIEALMAGAILLEQRNEWTRQFLTPGGDYFEWDTLADIKRILENLRNDPVEAERIRQNSLTRARFYTARRFWNNVERLVK
jgi:hypothetical protein